MRVKKLIDRLDNSQEVKERGLHVVTESTAPVDMEKLQYTSPVYGVMEFTKIASKLPEPVAQGNNGWIVALNVDKVEHLPVYENDLKRTNEEQFLVSQYARPAERLLGGFPGYTAIVDAHVQAMTQAGARRILDLGSGPGFLAKKLLEAQLSVTSVDHNDAMIEIARERCGDPDDFTMVKANVETLHSPDDFYDVTKIGIAPPYDGACMLDLYQWLRDPRALLRRLVQEKLLSPGACVTVSLPCGRDLLRAINSQAASRREPKDFEYFSNLMSYVIDHKPALSGDAVAEDLEVTGYRIVKKGQIPYAIDRQKFDGFPFLVAEAPHE
jgi:trans-aconitate methyltransferase